MAGRFKTPSVAQPNSRLRTPMKAKKTSKSNLSLVSEYDNLCTKSETFHEGGEEKLLIFLKSAKNWQKKMLYAEAERKRLSIVLKETERELSSKDQKIKQAREMINQEMRERQRIENECDDLQKQWGALQNLVNSGGNQINNDTLQKIRNSVSTDKLLRTPSTRTPRYLEQFEILPRCF